MSCGFWRFEAILVTGPFRRNYPREKLTSSIRGENKNVAKQIEMEDIYWHYLWAFIKAQYPTSVKILLKFLSLKTSDEQSYSPQHLASANNTSLGLDNFRYHAQTRPLIPLLAWGKVSNGLSTTWRSNKEFLNKLEPFSGEIITLLCPKCSKNAMIVSL